MIKNSLFSWVYFELGRNHKEAEGDTGLDYLYDELLREWILFYFIRTHYNSDVTISCGHGSQYAKGVDIWYKLYQGLLRLLPSGLVVSVENHSPIILT